MDTTMYALSVESNLFSFGMSWEEPEEVPGEEFFVRAEAPDGRRYAHVRTFRMDHSCRQQGCNEIGVGRPDWRCPDHAKQKFKSESAARAAAEKLLARVQAAQKAGTWKGPGNNKHWREIQPVYGSEAYEDGGWEQFNAEREREEARWENGGRR